eukprot:COSAG02_NODE_2191_length_9562_cov_35.619888_7_plen_135_part_00
MEDTEFQYYVLIPESNPNTPISGGSDTSVHSGSFCMVHAGGQLVLSAENSDYSPRGTSVALQVACTVHWRVLYQVQLYRQHTCTLQRAPGVYTSFRTCPKRRRGEESVHVDVDSKGGHAMYCDDVRILWPASKI